jgi:hypothetical protein
MRKFAMSVREAKISADSKKECCQLITNENECTLYQVRTSATCSSPDAATTNSYGITIS